MRLALAGLLLVGLAHGALAQQAQQVEPKLKLELSVEDTMLIVQTLGQISCQTVQQLAMCNKAAALLADIQRQAKAQGQ